jgi:Leucine-rich repeat (LRR) protein
MKVYLALLVSMPFVLVQMSCERLDPNESQSEIPVNIPDPEFLFELIDDKIDTNRDSIISQKEAEAVTFLNLSNYFGPDITDLTGIEAFKNLQTLVCRCNKIADLDLSMNTKLQEVYAYDNDLRSIDVTGCKDLILLHVGYDGVCNKNKLTKLDISKNHKLKTLDCSYNLLTEIDVSNNQDLESLRCQVNQIIELDLSNNIHLEQLEVWTNQLKALDISICKSLTKLNFAVNQITDIVLENNTLLEKLNASKNFITILDVSNNPALKILIVKDMPTLKNICVESLSTLPVGLNIYSSDNNQYRLTSDCL